MSYLFTLGLEKIYMVNTDIDHTKTNMAKYKE
jgi:hypothetical protein